MSLKELVIKKDALTKEIEDLYSDYKKNNSDLHAKLKTISDQIEISKCGLDVDMVEIGLSLLNINGDVNSEAREDCINDAISDIASGCKKIKKEYFGTKDYEHFRDQRCNVEYGLIPRHGAIVFSVGLSSEYRESGLTDIEIDNSLYVLMNIKTIQRAKRQ